MVISPAIIWWHGTRIAACDRRSGHPWSEALTRNRLLQALGVASCLVASHAASAQQAGVYSGTAKDGSNISFTIGTDASTGNLQVTAVGIGLIDTCTPGAFTYNTGWGLGGDGTDLTGNTGTYNFSYGYLYVTATLKFVGKVLIGTVANATPTLIEPASGEPKKAAYCSGKQQTFKATLQTGTAAAAVAMPRALFYGEIRTRR